MIRTLALVSTLVAASLSASALSAQSSATTTPAAPAMKPAPTVHAKADSTKMGAAAAKPSATTTRHAAWTKEQIKEAQEGLAKAGFYKGTATGVFNKGTRKALRAYQKQNKLPVTGRLSDDVLAKLKSA
jgi:peptidoglycan hydrolase-like protein with peptidoglycan-binding domain